MKRFALVLAFATLLAGAGCQPPAPPAPKSGNGALLRWHFAGTAAVLRDQEAVTLNKLAALPTTPAFRGELEQRTAQLATRFLGLTNAAATQRAVALLQPLAADLISSESYLEWSGPESAEGGVILSKLPPGRAGVWQTNLVQVMALCAGSSPIASSRDGVPAWEIRDAAAKPVARISQVGEWMIVGWGGKGMAFETQAVQSSRAPGGRPVAALSTHWLEADINLPRLHPWLPKLPFEELPVVQMVVSNRTDYIRLRANLDFARPLGWKPGAWQIPTNIVADPLVGFTAVRGVSSVLARTDLAKKLNLDNPPDQVFCWSLDKLAPMTFWAAPSPSAKQLVAHLCDRIPAVYQPRLTQQSMGIIDVATNKLGLQWQRIPMLLPTLMWLQSPSGDCLVGGLMPVPLLTNPPPTELVSQIVGRDDLMFYSWEITQARLAQLDLVDRTVIPLIFSGLRSGTQTPARVWLKEAEKLIGNTITEATLASPSRVTVVRKSHVGLTGLELITLLKWLDFPQFPSMPPDWSHLGPLAPSRPASPRP